MFTGWTRTEIVSQKQKYRKAYRDRKRTGKSKEYLIKLKYKHGGTKRCYCPCHHHKKHE